MKKIYDENEQAKTDIKKVPVETLIAHHLVTPAKKSGVTCKCGNGSGKDGTGLHSFWCDDAWLHKCYVCGETFDNLDLIAQHLNLDIKRDFPKVLAEGATLLGGMADIPTSSVHVSVKKKAEEIPQDFSAFIEEASSFRKTYRSNFQVPLSCASHFTRCPQTVRETTCRREGNFQSRRS